MKKIKQNTGINRPNGGEKYDTSTFNRQIIASISWCLVTLCVGMSFAFTGTLLSFISPTYISEEEGSWLVATNLSSMVIGALLSTISTRAIGNKSSILVGNVIWICGWICLSVAAHLYLFLVGCFLVGFSAGLGNKISMIYLIEMPKRELRGIISAINSACFTFGMLLGHLVSIILPWRRALQSCTLIPLLSLVFLNFSPELPNWLLTKGRLEKAKKTFFWLHGASPESEAEFAKLVSRGPEILARRQNSTIRTIFSRSFMIPFFVAATLFTTQSVSAFDSLMLYAVDMLEEMSAKIDAHLVTILFDTVSVVCGIISCYLIKKFSRRGLILTGAGGTILSLILVISTIHFELPVTLLIICLCIFSASANLGLIPVVWLIPAEIFPEINRDLGVSVSTTYYYVLTAVFAKVVPFLTSTYGMQITLGILTIAFCICTTLIFFFMPETKKLTLQELENEINKGTFGQTRNEPARSAAAGFY